MDKSQYEDDMPEYPAQILGMTMTDTAMELIRF